MPFIGEFDFRWLDDGRNMRLLNDLIYISPKTGKKVFIPAGEKTDGASIPQFLWSIEGGPFEGKHRKAAIPHDKLCRTQELTWQETHRIFLEAMLETGVEPFDAIKKYKAVYRFGPRWG